MSRWRSVIAGVGIMVGGAAAALPFRQTDHQVPLSDSAQAGRDGEQRHFDVILQLAAASDESPAWQVSRRAGTSRSAAEPRPARASLEGFEPPPRLGPNFRAFDQNEPVAHTPTTNPDGEQETSTKHRIADGDTLEALAERYFGDPELWQPIYQANRHVLSTPDVLPLGVEIVIPPVDAANTATAELVPVLGITD